LFKKTLVAAALLAVTSVAQAHFQLLQPTDLLLEKGGKQTLKMPFTHPSESGKVMDIAKPESFTVLHKGKSQDLSEQLQSIEWTSAEGPGKAWQADVKLRSMGDYVYVLTPQPYFEETEDAYIQQITKTVMNVGSLPTDWDAELGLKAEIVPLIAPYALFTGNVFTGVVKSQGKLVPFAEIEVEHLNFPVDMKANRFGETARINFPADAFVTQVIKADANGTFHFGIPKSGFWGFAALGVGPDTEHNGKELSQDAVIWVQAQDLK